MVVCQVETGSDNVTALHATQNNFKKKPYIGRTEGARTDNPRDENEDEQICTEGTKNGFFVASNTQ